MDEPRRHDRGDDRPGRPRERLRFRLAAHLSGPDPLVLVSLGTLRAGTDEFFRACFDLLADLPARVLLVVGSTPTGARAQPVRSTAPVTAAGRSQVVVSSTDEWVSAASCTDSMISRTCRASSSPARCGRPSEIASAMSASP